MATITGVMQEEIEKIKEEVCDGYCKWPDIYLARYEDPDIAHDVMLETECPDCPMCRI